MADDLKALFGKSKKFSEYIEKKYKSKDTRDPFKKPKKKKYKMRGSLSDSEKMLLKEASGK